MTAAPATIDLPRMHSESSRAYAARVSYITMGPQRSTAKVAQTLGKTKTLMDRWCERYQWVEHARRYDDAMAASTIQEAATQYRADLEEHRKRYQQSGRALHGVAVEMLTRLRSSTATIEYTPAALATISRALTVAADLEAHALRLADLLPNLTPDVHDSE